MAPLYSDRGELHCDRCWLGEDHIQFCRSPLVLKIFYLFTHQTRRHQQRKHRTTSTRVEQEEKLIVQVPTPPPPPLTSSTTSVVHIHHWKWISNSHEHDVVFYLSHIEPSLYTLNGLTLLWGTWPDRKTARLFPGSTLLCVPAHGIKYIINFQRPRRHGEQQH